MKSFNELQPEDKFKYIVASVLTGSLCLTILSSLILPPLGIIDQSVVQVIKVIIWPFSIMITSLFGIKIDVGSFLGKNVPLSKPSK